MSTHMSRAKLLALFAAAAFVSTVNAQTPAPAPIPPIPPTPPVTEPTLPPIAPTPPVAPLPPSDPTWMNPPTTPIPPVAPIPPIEPIAPMPPIPPIAPIAPIPPIPPLPPMDFDYDFDRDFSFDFKASTPRAFSKVRPDDFDFDDMDFDIDATISKAMTKVRPAIASAISRSAIATSRAMSKITSTSFAPTISTIVSTTMSPAITTSAFEWQFSGISTSPQQGWASGDPADSLYRIARETLNRGEYRRASQLFDQIAQKYPNSVYAADSRYWKAFALYRIGSADDLREALRSLDSGTGRYSSALQVDAPTLATRIRGALAARGDNRAATLIQREASQTGTTCDKEDIAVRVEALNSLGQMDPESVMPMLRRLLQRRDDCSAGLRRSALFLIAKRGDAEAFNVLTTAAKSDPDLRIRSDAIRWLARMPGDQAIATLEDIVRTGDNADLQQAAIEALGMSDSPRARASIRSLIERTDVNEALRASALQSIDAEHTDDGGAYLRGIYSRLDTPRLQLADVRAIARVGGPANDQWLLALVRDGNASLDIRRVALSYAGRSNIAIGDLVKMYDSMADRPLREALISLYSRRTEPEATDKLIDIAKNGTDPELRRLASSNLSRKSDPRTKKLLLEIIDK
jgi:tetratricopeptide (TPR) repeat protein